MVKKIKNNKIIKRTLIFISVLVVLCTTLALPVLAQAPDVNINYIPGTNRIAKNFYFYDNGNLTFVVFADYKVDNVSFNSYSMMFTDYYYNTFYTGNIDNDFLAFDSDYTYTSVVITGAYANQTYSGTSLSDKTVSTALSSRGFTDYDISKMFIESYDNQFLYWEEQLIPVNDAFDRGYTQALNDYKAFEKGLFAIFNAPFVFVQNIVGFEIFGITLTEVLVFILILCIGYIILRFIGGALPL